jgi:hypothetical protein
MQVILTEEEYLKLKNRSDEDRRTYVKKIDVVHALQELLKEIDETRVMRYGPTGKDDYITRLGQKFMTSVQMEGDIIS